MNGFSKNDNNVFGCSGLGVFKKWKHDVELYFETIGPSWRGISGILQQAKRLENEFVASELSDVVSKVASRLKTDPINTYLFEFETKATLLYLVLMPKLGLKHSTELRQVGTTNGFELWRMLNRKVDPPRAEIGFQLKTEIAALAGKENLCKDFNMSVRFIKHLEQKLKEYVMETGEDVLKLNETLSHVVNQVIDLDTMDRMEEAKIATQTYEDVKVWIQTRDARPRARNRGAVKIDPNAMQYSVATPEQQAHAAIAPPSPPPGMSAQDPWQTGGGAPDPWASAPAYTSTPHDAWAGGGPPDSWAGDLDAFNKGGKGGKGKGKGEKPPLQCYNCEGMGHPKSVCSSQPGAGAAKGPVRCPQCSGYGHERATCPSKGGGRYSPPPGKGGGKSQNFYGKGSGAWGKDGGKGKGKISDFDQARGADASQGWPPATSADWQWPGAAAQWPGAAAQPAAAAKPQPQAPPTPWLNAAAAQPAHDPWAVIPGMSSVTTATPQ